MIKNRLIFSDSAIYGLSKDFGFRIDLYRPTEITDFRTGKKTIVRTKYPVKKGIVLPTQVFRDFGYANVLKAVGQFQFGGIIDVSQRGVLINKRYLPKGFQIDINDYIIFNGDRYELSNIGEMELANYWFLTMKQVLGQIRNEVFNKRVKHWLTFQEVLS